MKNISRFCAHSQNIWKFWFVPNMLHSARKPQNFAEFYTTKTFRRKEVKVMCSILFFCSDI